MIWHHETAEAVTTELQSSIQDGLSKEEAAKRLSDHGPNHYREKKSEPIFKHLKHQLSSLPMILVMLAAVFMFGYNLLRIYNGHQASLIEPLIIFLIPPIGHFACGIWQRYGTAKLDALSNIQTNTVNVLRDGEVIETITVTTATGWRYSFGHLPADNGYGHEYTYTIREDAVEGYYTRIDGMDLTNGRLPSTTPTRPNTPEDTTETTDETPEEPPVPERKTGTPAPVFEDMSDEELEELFDLFGYNTPLAAILPTGDETPVYPFVFGGIGLLAIALLILGRKRRRE